MTPTPPPDQFQRVEAIFHDARRLSGEERQQHLDQACGSDAGLRAEVESLLHEHDLPSGSFMSDPALGSDFQVGDAQRIAAGPAALPDRIGAYRLLRQIGEGGMGIVYLAQQEGTQRAVAIKLIRTGMGSPRAVQRFEREAIMLGRLRHPGIAQVYEAGVHESPTGRLPYIVMEYVDGTTLKKYLQEHQLDMPGRLALFLDICDAVGHAHQHGVIHRDLKPGNILVEEMTDTESATTSSEKSGVIVSPRGRPKILDFGVARATDADVLTMTLQTGAGQLLGTVQYMSPEQAGGDPSEIDVRSDVYALGVILYEMLAGVLPYDLEQRMIHDAVRIIREREPTPLSSIDHTYRGDLNTILCKALEKDRDRRYQSAADLAGDIRRYLNVEPILAHPQSALYQFRKFARRNRAIVSAVGVVFVVLVAAVVASSMQAISATRAREAEATARQRADQRFDDLRKLARSMLFDLDDRLINVSGTLPARQLLVETALEYLDRLALDARDDLQLKFEIATGYVKVGDVLGEPQSPNLGDSAGALDSYKNAILLFEDVQREDAELIGRSLVRAYSKAGDVNRLMNRHDEASEWFARAEGAAERRAAAFADDPEVQRDLLIARIRLGHTLGEADRTEESEALLAQTQKASLALQEQYPDYAPLKRDGAITHLETGMEHMASRKPEPALNEFGAYLRIVEELLADDPGNLVYRRDIGAGYHRVGSALEQLGRTDDAMDHYQLELQSKQALVDADPDDQRAAAELAAPYCKIGEMYLARGDSDEALHHFQRYLELSESAAQTNPASAEAQRDLGVAYYKFGELHASFGADESRSAPDRIEAWREAQSWFTQCLDQFKGMRDRGQLWQSDAGVFIDIQGRIEYCNKQLAAVQATPPTESPE